MKYLTKGHTHMTADGVHENIEKKLGIYTTLKTLRIVFPKADKI